MLLSYINIFLVTLIGFIPIDKPQFKGGSGALNSFIVKNTIYPSFSKNNCIQGTVKVSFRLDKNGQVFGAQVESGLGVDLDDEALRLIRLTNQKWEVSENHNENDRLIIPINFVLKNYDCDLRSRENIDKAIELYKVRTAMQDVVTNYYIQKENGKLSEKNEAEISQLKAELGFDEDFIDSQLKSAKKMLRQGDKFGACEIYLFIKHIGSNMADELIAENCK